MNFTGHFNTNNTELKLPALPDGYNWEVRETRHDDMGSPWLVVALVKTVPMNFFIRALTGFSAESRTKKVVVAKTSLGSYLRDLSSEVINRAFVIAAEIVYSEAFPEPKTKTPASIYAGTYVE